VAIAIIPGPGNGHGQGQMDDLDDSMNPMSHGGGGAGQLCVPEDVVATADDKDEKVAPEVGDEVRFDCVAKVVRVENGNVYLAPTEVNGQPVADADQDSQGVSAGDDEDSMRQMAEQADGRKC